jgi:prolipoprotein diacylglyceryl transferase
MIQLAAIASPSQNVIEIGPLTIHFYGILIAFGVIVAIVVSRLRYVRFGGSGELFERVAIWAVIIGFLGARAGYVVTHTGRFFGDTFRPWAVLYLWEGGLALYGGLLFGTLTVIFLMRRRHGDLFAFGDAVAVGIPLAQAIGRLGNYFNQELFGTPSDLPWAIIIDPANRPAGYEQFETFHPTFAYEALWNAIILVPVILWLERRGKLAKGASFGVYVVMYALIRFLMELMRTDTTFRVLGISRNGWVSVAAMLFGAGWIWYTQRRGEARTLIGEPRLLSPQPATVLAARGVDDAISSDPTVDGGTTNGDVATDPGVAMGDHVVSEADEVDEAAP